MSLLILLAEQNSVVQGAWRGALIGGIVGALAGPAIWGLRKLASRDEKKGPDEPDASKDR